jgi:hypothetical protein
VLEGGGFELVCARTDNASPVTRTSLTHEEFITRSAVLTTKPQRRDQSVNPIGS